MSLPTTIHTEMRRSERAVDSPVLIKAFLHRSKFMTLGVHDEPFPYLVPVSYGFELNNDGLVFYIHGAPEGHKIDLFAKNPNISFSIVEAGATFVDDDPACDSGQNYFSVIGCGTVTKVEGQECVKAMDSIMHHYAGDNEELSWTYPQAMLDKMGIWMLTVKELSGKTHSETPRR